jgi:hypothetical protein
MLCHSAAQRRNLHLPFLVVIPHHHALSFRSAAEESAFAFLGCRSAAQRRNLHLPLLPVRYKPSFRPKQDTLHRPAQRRNPCISGCQAEERNTGVSPLQPQTTRPPVEMTSSVSALACHSAAPCLSFRSAAKESAFAFIVCHSQRQSACRTRLSFRSAAEESAFAFIACHSQRQSASRLSELQP